MKNRTEKEKTCRLWARKLPRQAVVCVFLIALMILVFPQRAYAAEWWDIVGSIQESICGWLLSAAGRAFNDYFDIIYTAANTSYIAGTFSELFGSQEVWDFIKGVHEVAIIPLAESILALFMLVQFVKISQRMDATATLPAVKDIVVLAVFYVIFHWLIVNSLEMMTSIYDQLNAIVSSLYTNGAASNPLQELDWENIENLSDAKIGACLLLFLVSYICLFIGMFSYMIALVVSIARAIQLYVMAAFSPIPFSLLGFDETRQMGVGFLKNFCAAALAGGIIMFLLTAYPYILKSILGGFDTGTLTSIVSGGDSSDILLKMAELLGVSVLLSFGLMKSGAWAKEILGG